MIDDKSLAIRFPVNPLKPNERMVNVQVITMTKELYEVIDV